MTAEDDFRRARQQQIRDRGGDTSLKEASINWQKLVSKYQYIYGFEWLGRPIIQLPSDILALQQIIWESKPDLIIETGIAHGGSLIFSASMLELNAICGGPENAKVIGIDIDIRQHNRVAIESHPLCKRIKMLEGSSVATDITDQVKGLSENKSSVMVMLDSDHTHKHVLAELQAYAPLVSKGNYCIVCDTRIDDMPAEMFLDREWAPGNSPASAIRDYLNLDPSFVVDQEMDFRLLISVAPGGYLRKVR